MVLTVLSFMELTPEEEDFYPSITCNSDKKLIV